MPLEKKNPGPDVPRAHVGLLPPPAQPEVGTVVALTPSGKIINGDDGLQPLKRKRRSAVKFKKDSATASKKSDKNNSSAGVSTKSSDKSANDDSDPPPTAGARAAGKTDKSKLKLINKLRSRSSKSGTKSKEGDKINNKKKSDESPASEPRSTRSKSHAPADHHQPRNTRTATLEGSSVVVLGGTVISRSENLSSEGNEKSGNNTNKSGKSKKSSNVISNNNKTSTTGAAVRSKSKQLIKPENEKIVAQFPNAVNPSRNISKSGNKPSQMEPPFYSVITPEFFSKLKEVANESNVQANARKSKPAKMETLSELTEKEAKNNKSKKSNNAKSKSLNQITFEEARDALSLSHVPVVMKKPVVVEEPIFRKFPEETSVTSRTRTAVISKSENPSKSIMHGPGCHHSMLLNTKKLRFSGTVSSDAGLYVTNSNSNNTRRLSTNLLGGCMK